MNILTLLGILIAFLGNVFLGIGNFEDVRVGWGGLDRISQTHLMDITSMYQCDNYALDSKDEENPRYSVISVRPDKTAYLNATGNSVRGLFDYQTSSGDNLIIMATKDTVYRSSAGSWTTLGTGFYDSPWESVLYALPNNERIYLCNGLNNNKKFFSGRDILYDMQNQDNETTISGNLWFTQGATTATGDATAIASLEAGQYVKSATTDDDSLWMEITTIEGTTLSFSDKYDGSTASSAVCVRSNDAANSRHMIEYEGHLVTAYTSEETTISISNTVSTEYWASSMAYGIGQSFTATSNQMNVLRLKIYQFDKNDGNIILKIKTAIDSTDYISKITYPISSLPLNDGSNKLTDFNFGAVALTSGSTYYFTIERENSSAGYFQLAGGTAATGSVYWTYNSTGFDGNWNVGVTTIEVSPLASVAYGDPGGAWYPLGNFGTPTNSYLDQANPTISYFSFNPISLITSTYAGYFSGNQRRSIHNFYLDYGGVSTEASNWDNVKFSIYKTSSTSGEVKIYRKLTSAFAPWSAAMAPWTTAGCLSPEADYTATDTVSNANATTEAGWLTFEATSIARAWTPALANNYGILLSAETTAGHTFYADGAASSVRPKWTLTTATGKNETGKDLYFEIIKKSGQRSTVNYSRRYKPELFPLLNTFDVPGTIVGLAKSGGYLIVGTKRPDALHFFNATYDTADGLGIKDTTRINGITFGGGSHSIAYLPKADAFIFYSGLGVYMQKGLQTTLLSGKIREEAKGFTNYRDPLDYYMGFADLMPQAMIDPTKDTYMLAVPNALGVNSYLYNYNYANDAWTRWTALYPTAMLCRPERGGTPTIYLGGVDGQTYTFNKTGSITQEATLVWMFSGKDLTKKKQFNLIEFTGVVDNPLVNCVITLEAISTNPTATDVVKTPIRQTIRLANNTTTNSQVQLRFDSIGILAREIKLTLTQASDQGAVSWRLVRYKGVIKE